MTKIRLFNIVYLVLLYLSGIPLHSNAQDDTVTISFDPPEAYCIDDADNCTAAVSYDFQVGVDCPFGQLQVEAFLNIFNDGNPIPLANALSGSFPNYSLSGSYPLGAHSFEVVVDDGCGNVQSAVLPFEVVDCAVDTPVCQLGQAVEIPFLGDTDGDGWPDLTPTIITSGDFLAVAAQDCTPPLSYSINFEGEGIDPDQDSIFLTCDHEGTQVLELHVYDGAGNTNSCLTYLLVQDIIGMCYPDIGLGFGGHILTEAGEPVAGVPVAISGQASTIDTTDADGLFFFSNIISGLDYTFTPKLDEAPLNGVSTFDMILISRHILGVQPLNSPYKRIAADTNGSGHITALDLIQLRRMILGIENGFDQVDSWRFVDAAYTFPDPANPWAEEFPEVIHLDNLSMAFNTDQDFIAIKIGDVNGDAVTD
jgi:hypothetical protein